MNVTELLTLTPKCLNFAKFSNNLIIILILHYILMVKYRDFSEFTSRPSSLYWSCTHYYIFHQYQHIFFSLHTTFITKSTSKSHAKIILLYDCNFSLASIKSTIKQWAHTCNKVQSMLSDSRTQGCCKTNLFCTELQCTFVTPHKLSQVKPRICSIAHYLVASFI